MTRDDDLDQFYDLLRQLERRLGGKRRLGSSTGAMTWPPAGVYFFFEPGEYRRDGSPRVVRVGTHPLTATSRTTLWNRLSAHRGHIGGKSPGGGNHRGSIFRLHVGAALMARDPAAGWPSTWGVGSSAPATTRTTEQALERAVSAHLGNMELLWLSVPTPEERGFVERNAIALLSNARKTPIDLPSTSWLGHTAQREAIRDSGLWNVNHVYDPLEQAFLEAFARLVNAA